jgi:hypothetical protein
MLRKRFSLAWFDFALLNQFYASYRAHKDEVNPHIKTRLLQLKSQAVIWLTVVFLTSFPVLDYLAC